MALSPIARFLALDARPGWTGNILEARCAGALEALGLRPDAVTRIRRSLLGGVIVLGLALQGAGSFGLVPFEIYGPALMASMGALFLVLSSRGIVRSLVGCDGTILRVRLETRDGGAQSLVLAAESAEWARDLPRQDPDEARAGLTSPSIAAEVAVLVLEVAAAIRRAEALLGEDGAELARGWILMGKALEGLERRGATIVSNPRFGVRNLVLAIVAGVSGAFVWGPMAGITVFGVAASLITLNAPGAGRRSLRLRDLDGEMLLATDQFRDASYTLELAGSQGEASGSVEIRGLTDEALVEGGARLLDPVLDRVATAGHLATRTAIR